MRTWEKRRRPAPPGTSDTTRAAIASSSWSSSSSTATLAQTRERVEGELSAQHRREQQHAVALLREVGEPAGDHVPDVLRDGEPELAGRIRLGSPRARGGEPSRATKSGFPSVSSCRAAPSSGDAIVGAVRSTYSITSRSLRPPSESRRVPGSRATSTSISSTVARGQDRRRGTHRGRAGGSSPARGRETEAARATADPRREDRPGRAPSAELAHALRRNSAVASSRRNCAPSESREGGSGSPGSSSRSSGRIWASSTAPVPSWARSSSGAPPARTRGATAPRASRRARHPPPSSGR